MFGSASEIGGLVALLALTGCSVGTLESVPCQSNDECRSSFGLGAVCGDTGLCRVEAPSLRCDRSYPEDLLDRPEDYGDAFVVGNLMDRSEPKKVARERAARLAAIQANEVGGLDGRPLALVMCTIEPNHEGDGLDLDDAATTTARHLVDVLGAGAIVGPSSSGNTLAVFDELRGTGTVVISPSATSPELTDLEPAPSDASPGLLWRTAPSDAIQGPVIAQDMQARGITTVAAVVQKGAYGDGLRDVFVAALDASVTVTDFPYELEFERTEAITAAGLTDVDEVLFISSESSDISAFLTTAASDAAYAGKSIFLTDAAASLDVVGGANPSLFTRLRGTRPMPLDDTELVYKNFVNGYLTQYGEDATQFSFTAHAYDAAWMAFYGTAWSHLNEGGVSGAGIARGLRRVSDGAPFEVKAGTWPDIVTAFGEGQSVNVRGSSGELDYDPATEETTGTTEVWVAVEIMGAVSIQPAP